MPNPTHPHWQNDPAILKAAKNAPPLRKGAKGSGVQRLREALEVLGAERTLEPLDTFGPLTEMLVRSFQITYGLAIDGVAGAGSIAKLDQLLFHPEARKPLTKPVVGNAKGKAYFVKHLAMSQKWADNAAFAATTAHSALVANQPTKVSPIVAFAFLLHFRLNVLDRAPAGQVAKIPDYLIEYASVEQVKLVMDTLQQTAGVLRSKQAACYVEADIGTDWARCDAGGPIRVNAGIGEPERPAQSAAWVTNHELVHWVMGEKSFHKDGINPYSKYPSYYLAGWIGCRFNPDSYAHFAAHLALGRPVLGEWWSACV